MFHPRAKSLLAILAACALLTSCGLISNSESEQVDGVLGPAARNGTLPPTTTTTTASGSSPDGASDPAGQSAAGEPQVPGSAAAEGSPDGSNSADGSANEAPGSDESAAAPSTSEPPPIPPVTKPDPELLAAAMDSCQRIANLQQVGYEFLIASQNKAVMSVDEVERVIEAFLNLGPVVPPEYRTVFGLVEDVMGPGLRLLQSTSQTIMQTRDLEMQFRRIAPHITQIMSAVYPVCPKLMDPDAIGQVEHMHIGRQPA